MRANRPSGCEIFSGWKQLTKLDMKNIIVTSNMHGLSSQVQHCDESSALTFSHGDYQPDSTMDTPFTHFESIYSCILELVSMDHGSSMRLLY